MKAETPPVIPPAFLQGLATSALQKAYGSAIDLRSPPGEAALVPPHSISWRVFKNPIAMFAGGVAAVVLELAEPKVRAGVWDHTSFRKNPGARLRRTGVAAMMTVYGPRAATEKMIANVRRMHERVTGTTDRGEAYRANDPDLLDWVQATAAFGFLQGYHRFVAPLSKEARDSYYSEGTAAAKLYGATSIQVTEAELNEYFRRMEPRLEPSAVIFEFLDIMQRAALFPAALRPLQRMLVRAGVTLVPEQLRRKLHIGGRGLGRREEALVRFLGRQSDRLVLRGSPAVQACERLGLPIDYLYRPLSRPA